MPRQKSGKPEWKSIAVKLPPELHQEVMDFTDRHHRDITISELVREGIIWRMKQPVVPHHGQITEPSDQDSPMVDDRRVWDATALEQRCNTLEADFAKLREQVQSLETRLHHAQADPDGETAIPQYGGITTTSVREEDETPSGANESYSGTTVIPESEVPADTMSGVPEADTPSIPHRKPGRKSGPMRQQILALLADHPEGLSPEQIRGLLNPGRSIKDILQGMRRAGLLELRGEGYQKRYFLA